MFYNGIFISEASPRECERRATAIKCFDSVGPLLNGEVFTKGSVGQNTFQSKRNTCMYSMLNRYTILFL